MSKINKRVFGGHVGMGGPTAVMATRRDPTVTVRLIREEENFLTRCAGNLICLQSPVRSQ